MICNGCNDCNDCKACHERGQEAKRPRGGAGAERKDTARCAQGRACNRRWSRLSKAISLGAGRGTASRSAPARSPHGSGTRPRRWTGFSTGCCLSSAERATVRARRSRMRPIHMHICCWFSGVSCPPSSIVASGLQLTLQAPVVVPAGPNSSMVYQHTIMHSDVHVLDTNRGAWLKVRSTGPWPAAALLAATLDWLALALPCSHVETPVGPCPSVCDAAGHRGRGATGPGPALLLAHPG